MEETGSKFNLVEGFASNKGTRRFLEKAVRKGKPEKHFRKFDDLYLSSIGMGTYLGDLTEEDDKKMENAIYESIKDGALNVIDTAINYRSMKSEKTIGRTILKLINEDIISRDEIFISTKNGYITNDADYPGVQLHDYIQKMFIDTEIIKPNDISSGYNILNPNYIAKCIDKSLMNLNVKTIDLVYIHNAYESWYQDVNKKEFMDMLENVFRIYEEYRKNNNIKYYGMATWTCFRVDKNNREYLSLEEVYKIAKKVGGNDNGFKFIQLPYNLNYSEVLFLRNQDVGDNRDITILEAAGLLDIGVFTSIPFFQGKLFNIKIPEYADGLTNNAMKIIQIIRSTPNILAPLIGQKKIEHVLENIAISNIPPLEIDEFKESIKILTKN